MRKFTKCWYRDCDSDNRNDLSILFYKFPKDTERCIQWVNSCSNPELTELWNTNPEKVGCLRVCHKHFLKEFLSSSCRLVGHAVPAPFGVALDQIDAKKFMVECASLKSTSIKSAPNQSQCHRQQETVSQDSIQYSEQSFLVFHSYDQPLVSSCESYTSTSEQTTQQQAGALLVDGHQQADYQQLAQVADVVDITQDCYLTSQLIDTHDISHLRIHDGSCLVTPEPEIVDSHYHQPQEQQQTNYSDQQVEQQQQLQPQQQANGPFQQLHQLHLDSQPEQQPLYSQPEQQQLHNQPQEELQPLLGPIPLQQQANDHDQPQNQPQEYLCQQHHYQVIVHQPQQHQLQLTLNQNYSTDATTADISVASRLKSITNANPKIVYDKFGKLVNIHYETESFLMKEFSEEEQAEIHVIALKHKARHYQRENAVTNHRYRKLRSEVKGGRPRKIKLLEAIDSCKADLNPIICEIFEHHVRNSSSNHGNRWSTNLKNFSAAIYLRSQGAYKFLKSTINLPSETMIKSHIKANKISGVSNVIKDVGDDGADEVDRPVGGHETVADELSDEKEEMDDDEEEDEDDEEEDEDEVEEDEDEVEDDGYDINNSENNATL